MQKRYPRTLSSGANNTVIALSETEVGKLFTRFAEQELKEFETFREFFLSR